MACGPDPPQLHAFVNKVLLEHSHAYLFIICGCFYSTVAELSSCKRNDQAHKAVNILYLLYKKCWLASSLQEADFPVYSRH